MDNFYSLSDLRFDASALEPQATAELCTKIVMEETSGSTNSELLSLMYADLSDEIAPRVIEACEGFSTLIDLLGSLNEYEPTAGLEPATDGLQNRYSTN